MLEAGGDSNLPEKALGAECGDQLVAQDLDGDGPVVLEVAGEVDRGHAAAAQLALEAVAVAEGGLKRRHGIGQAHTREGCSKMSRCEATG